MDSSEFGERVVERLRALVGDSLRSVVGYTREDVTVHYVRDDVASRYTDEEIDRAVEELRLETLEEEYLNSVFESRHGPLYCRVAIFEEAVEMNFAVTDGEGLAVAVDTDYFAEEGDVVRSVMREIEQYATWEL